MGDRSKIEWTDLPPESAFGKRNTFKDSIAWLNTLFIHPIVQILMLLGAIAATTGWYHIPRGGLSALGDGYNMVKRVGHVAAVSTRPLKLFHDDVATDLWYHPHPTLSNRVFHLNPNPEAAVCLIALSCFAIKARPASSLKNTIDWKPIFTPSAPGLSLFLHKAPVSCSWTICCGLVNTASTGRIKTAPPAPIYSELDNITPVLSFRAPLHSGFYFSKIFGEWQANTSGRNFHDASYATHKTNVLSGGLNGNQNRVG